MSDELITQLIEEIRKINVIHSNILDTFQILILPQIESRLKHVFPSTPELQAYKLSDGDTPSRVIGQHVGVSHTTITNWWKKWEKDFNIVETPQHSNTYRAKYSLAELVLLFGKYEEKDMSND